MKITYTEYVPDPKLRGTTAHLPAHIAQVLIASGQAKAVPYKDFREILADDDAVRAAAAPPVTVEWGIRDKDRSVHSQVLIIRKLGAELSFFLAPPKDCPPSIVQQWKDMTKVDTSADRVAFEKAKQEQQARQHDEKIGVLQDIYKNW